MMNGLAFLPLEKVQEGIKFLNGNILAGFEDVSYFSRSTFRPVRLFARDEESFEPPPEYVR